MRWALLLLIPLALYAGIVALFYFGQTRMLFPARSSAQPVALPSTAERLSLPGASGDRLTGVHIPPAIAGAEPVIILGFGGNAWNADVAARYLHNLYPNAGIVTFHYRGYRPSQGAPSAAAFVADAPLIFDFVRERFGKARIIVVGFSIGSGVASSLAAQRQVEGLILVTPFDSLRRVASGLYPWLPVGSLLRHQLEPAQDLRAVDAPTAIIAGREDRLIRPARTAPLRRAARNLVLDRVIDGADHNSIYDDETFKAAMREALNAMVQR